MDKKEYERLNNTLLDTKAKASEKLKARDAIMKNLKERMPDASEEQLKQAKAKLNNKIKQGNFKKTGAIDNTGIVSEGLRPGAKSGAKKAGKTLAKKISRKFLSAIPFVGGLASAVSSGDASAAVPVLGDSEATGPKKGSLDAKLEDPSLSMEERKKIQEIIKKKYKRK